MPVLDGIGATKAIRAVEAARRKHTRSISLPVNDSPFKTTATASNGGSQDGRETSEDGSAMLSGPEGGSGGKLGQPGRVRILALTGLATEGDKKMAFASGVDGYLVKPVSLKTLSSVFKKVGF
jgi:CheY-like chemotaxis protein